jgi:HNH endonuclease
MRVTLGLPARTTAMAAETRVRYAHRVAWELANGEKIPEGMFVLHGPGCPRNCCNPTHLRVGVTCRTWPI